MKKPNFNNPRAIIVLAEQNSWATCGSLRQRLTSSAPAWIFFSPNIVIPQLSGAWNIQTAKVQQCTCHYCPTRSRHLGDLWIAAPTTQERRHGVNFLQKYAAVVREKAKVQQCTCHYCPTTAKHLSDLWNAAPTTPELRPRHEFFGKFCCRGEVSGTWESQSSTTQVPLSSRHEVSGAWNSQIWTLNTSDLKRRLADTMDKHITKRHRRSCWSKLLFRQAKTNFDNFDVPVRFRGNVSSASNSQSSTMHVPLYS